MLMGLADWITVLIEFLDTMVLHCVARIAPIDCLDLCGAPLGLAGDLLPRLGFTDHEAFLEFPNPHAFKKGDGVEDLDSYRFRLFHGPMLRVYKERCNSWLEEL